MQRLPTRPALAAAVSGTMQEPAACGARPAFAAARMGGGAPERAPLAARAFFQRLSSAAQIALAPHKRPSAPHNDGAEAPGQGQEAGQAAVGQTDKRAEAEDQEGCAAARILQRRHQGGGGGGGGGGSSSGGGSRHCHQDTDFAGPISHVLPSCRAAAKPCSRARPAALCAGALQKAPKRAALKAAHKEALELTKVILFFSLNVEIACKRVSGLAAAGGHCCSTRRTRRRTRARTRRTRCAPASQGEHASCCCRCSSSPPRPSMPTTRNTLRPRLPASRAASCRW